MYTAPSGTHIETVCLDFNLRRDGHHQAEILAYPGFQVLASGGDGPAGWTNRCYDLRHSQLIVRLACAHAGGCPEGLNAHAFVRNMVIALADDVDPAITAFGGDMTDPGWLRGTKTLIADAADAGSGVFHLVGYVNGEEIARVGTVADTGGLPWNFAVRLAPCDADVSSRSAVQRDTSDPPFVERREHGDRIRRGLRRQRRHAEARRSTSTMRRRGRRSRTSWTRADPELDPGRASRTLTRAFAPPSSTTAPSGREAGCRWTPA